ncbi:MAG TPA: hypothetical protein VL175_13570 [Pirellulales bacterium]|jgi:hypothetical protein|nr:hypothetical protein [Pirellulales bacterium]
MVLRLALTCLPGLALATCALAGEPAPPRYPHVVVLPANPIAIEARPAHPENPIARRFSDELLPIWPAGKHVFAALPNYEPGSAKTVFVAPLSSRQPGSRVRERTR